LAYNWLRKTILVALITMLLILIGSTIVIASMPIESFPIRGTFTYNVWVEPDYEASVDPISFVYSISSVSFTYSSYWDVSTPVYQPLPMDRLRIFPDTLEDDLMGWGNGSPLADDNNFHVAVSYSWQNTRNSSSNSPVSGTYWVANSRGITPPDGATEGWNFPTIVVDLNDIISRSNVINDTLTLTWSLNFGRLIATFDTRPPQQGFTKSAWIDQTYVQDYTLYVQFANGTATKVTASNETTGHSFSSAPGIRFNTTEWVYRDSLDIPNPTVLQAKEDIPILLAASFILTCAVPIAQYYPRPKQTPLPEPS
jgi:hypothetical protein